MPHTCHRFGWGLPHLFIVKMREQTHRCPVPRTRILLTLAVVALVGLSTPVTQASISINESPGLIATINVGGGTTPYGIAVTPDGSKVFVSNSTRGSVSVIETASLAVSTTVTANVGTTPVGISLDSSGTTAYVGNYTAGTITAINVISGTTTSHDIAAATGHQCDWILNLRVSFDDSELFLACQDDSRVQVLDLPLSRNTGRLLELTGNNNFPTDVAVTADDATLVVPVNGSGTNANTALFITLANTAANSYLPVNIGAFSVAISPTSRLAYLAGRNSGAISVVNPETRTSAGTDIVVGGDLTDIVITPDGSRAIVSVLDEDVVKFVDLATGGVTHSVGVGGLEPQSIALSQDGRFLYTANRSGSVGVIRVPVPPASGDQVPTAPLQQFARTESDTCETQPENLVDFPALGHVKHTHWGPSWAQWPNDGTGGFVCTRQPYYTSADTWNVR